MTYSYRILVGSSWIDISRLINSKNTKITYNSCNESFKSIADTASVTLTYSDKDMFRQVANSLIDNGDDDIILEIKQTEMVETDEDTDTMLFVEPKLVYDNTDGTYIVDMEDKGNLIEDPVGSGKYILDLDGVKSRVIKSKKAVTTTIFFGYIPNGVSGFASGSLPESITLSAQSFEEKLSSIKYKGNVSYVGEKASTLVSVLLDYAKERLYGYKNVRGTHPSSADVIADNLSINASDLDARVRYFVATEDDGSTVKDLIDGILFECCGYAGFGWALDYDHTGKKFKISQTVGYIDSARIETLKNSESARVHYAVSSKLKTQRSDIKNDGIAVKYYTTEDKLDGSVYTDDIDTTIAEEGDEDGVKKGTWKGTIIYSDNHLTVAEGEESRAGKNYYPYDADITTQFQEYENELLDTRYQLGKSRKQNEDIDLLFVYNNSATLEVNASDLNGNSKAITAWSSDTPQKFYTDSKKTRPSGPVVTYPKKAWVVLHNSTTENINLQSLGIKGDAVYRNKEHQIVAPATSENPEEITLKYAVRGKSSDDAKAYHYSSTGIRMQSKTDVINEIDSTSFAKWYYNAKCLGRDKITWSDVDNSNPHALGDYVYATLKGTDRGVPCVIVGKSVSCGIIDSVEYTALSVSDYVETVDTVSNAGQSLSALVVTEYQKEVAAGKFTGSEQAWVKALAVDAVGSSTTEYYLALPGQDVTGSEEGWGPLSSWNWRYSYIWWKRSKKAGGSVTEPVMDSMLTSEYEKELFFSFSVEKNTFEYNGRNKTRTQTIRMESSLSSGYGKMVNGSLTDATVSVSVTGDATVDGTSLVIPYGQSTEITVRATVEYSKYNQLTGHWEDMSDVFKTFVLAPIDVTEKAYYIGASEYQNPNASQLSYPYDNFLYGDMFIYENGEDATIRMWNGSVWTDYTDSYGNYNVLLEASKYLTTDTNHTVKNGMDIFGTLVAQKVVSDEIFANGLKSVNYAEVDGIPTSGFKMEGDTIKAVGFIGRNVKIDGTSSFDGDLRTNGILESHAAVIGNHTYTFDITQGTPYILVSEIKNAVDGDSVHDFGSSVINSIIFSDIASVEGLSKTYSDGICDKSEETITLDAFGSSSYNYPDNYSFNVSENGYLHASYSISGSNYTFEIRKNGNAVSISNKISVSRGDTVQFYLKNNNSGWSGNRVYAYITYTVKTTWFEDYGITSNGLYALSDNSVAINLTGYSRIECVSSDHVGNISPYYTYESNNRYKIDGNFSDNTFLFKGVVSGTITVNGSTVSLGPSTSAWFSGQSFIIGGKEITVSDYYKSASFTFYTSESSALLAVGSMSPIGGTDINTIGMSNTNRFLAGYFKNLFADKITVGSIDSNDKGLSVVACGYKDVSHTFNFLEKKDYPEYGSSSTITLRDYYRLYSDGWLEIEAYFVVPKRNETSGFINYTHSFNLGFVFNSGNYMLDFIPINGPTDYYDYYNDISSPSFINDFYASGGKVENKQIKTSTGFTASLYQAGLDRYSYKGGVETLYKYTARGYGRKI